MPPANNNKFLFIHVMKTGGTSLSNVIGANFPANVSYPDACLAPDAHAFHRFEAYLFVPGLVEKVNALNGQLRMVRGHFPYAVRELLDDSYIAMTLLRDPVERTLSYLKHCRKYHNEHVNLELEQIYEDTWFRATFIQNYQTKLFSMSAQEALTETRFPDDEPKLPPRRELGDGQNLSDDIKAFRARSPGRVSLECFSASTGVIQVDNKRLSIAMENLSAVEVVGTTEHYDRFLRQLVDRYGWQITSVPHLHASKDATISPAFRQRIAFDNAFDMELYEYARSLST